MDTGRRQADETPGGQPDTDLPENEGGSNID
jgi:hypothetical protein